MSKYTTEVRYLVEHFSKLDPDVSTINEMIKAAAPTIFNFDFPIFDENYRPVLEQKILKHYYTREIGEETYGLWKLRLDTRLNEIMPYYNKLYNSELLKFNPLYDVDLWTKKDEKTAQDEVENRQQNQNYHADAWNTQNVQADSTENVVDNFTGKQEENRTDNVDTNADYEKHINTTETELDVEHTVRDVTENGTKNVTDNETINRTGSSNTERDTTTDVTGKVTGNETQNTTDNSTTTENGTKNTDTTETHGGTDTTTDTKSGGHKVTDTFGEVDTKNTHTIDTADVRKYSDTPQGTTDYVFNEGSRGAYDGQVGSYYLTNITADTHGGETTDDTKVSHLADDVHVTEYQDEKSVNALEHGETITGTEKTTTENTSTTDKTGTLKKDTSEDTTEKTVVDDTTNVSTTDDTTRDYTSQTSTENTTNENVQNTVNKDTTTDTFETNKQHETKDDTYHSVADTQNNDTTDTTQTSTRNTDFKSGQSHSDDLNRTTNTNINTTNDYLQHVGGKRGYFTYSKMLMEFRDTFLNIDKMIIDALGDLFMTIW